MNVVAQKEEILQQLHFDYNEGGQITTPGTEVLETIDRMLDRLDLLQTYWQREHYSYKGHEIVEHYILPPLNDLLDVPYWSKSRSNQIHTRIHRARNISRYYNADQQAYMATS